MNIMNNISITRPWSWSGAGGGVLASSLFLFFPVTAGWWTRWTMSSSLLLLFAMAPYLVELIQYLESEGDLLFRRQLRALRIYLMQIQMPLFATLIAWTILFLGPSYFNHKCSAIVFLLIHKSNSIVCILLLSIGLGFFGTNSTMKQNLPFQENSAISPYLVNSDLMSSCDSLVEYPVT